MFPQLSPLASEPPSDLSDPSVDLAEFNHLGWVKFLESLFEKELNLDHLPESEAQAAFDRVVESMIRHGFGVNKKLLWQDGQAIHRAVQKGCLRTLEALINHGADVNAYTDGDCGSTPLYVAACENQIDAARLLIARGADVNRKSGQTGFEELPLHVATSPELCRLLVVNGCPVNAQSSSVFHESALHWAAHCARPDTVLALLKLGAQDFHYPGRGSALDVARKVHYQSCGVMGGGEWDLKTTRLTVTLLENPDLAELLFQNESSIK